MDEGLYERARISVILVFFTALAIFGAAAVGAAVNDYARARASLSWPVAEGVVLEARKSAPVRYIYSVDGMPYEATRIGFFTGRLRRPDVQEPLTPGARVDVYVSPREPSFSVLRPGGAGWLFALVFLAGGLGVFIGIGGIVRTIEKAARDLAR